MNIEIKDVLLNGSTVDIALRDGKIASISPAVGTAQQVPVSYTHLTLPTN